MADRQTEERIDGHEADASCFRALEAARVFSLFSSIAFYR